MERVGGGPVQAACIGKQSFPMMKQCKMMDQCEEGTSQEAAKRGWNVNAVKNSGGAVQMNQEARVTFRNHWSRWGTMTPQGQQISGQMKKHVVTGLSVALWWLGK